MWSQISRATALLQPFFFAPAMNCSANFCMISGFFLPIALRRLSASRSERSPSRFAISITCSW
jgi:hypothetical protein